MIWCGMNGARWSLILDTFDMRLSGHDTKELAMDSFASTQRTFDDLVD